MAQAPAEAAGYRLVLLGRDDRDAPRILPDPAPDGAMRFWRLLPFELPDDIRLRDGMVYRLLWVNEQGGHVGPGGNSSLPGLHFFLGPAELPHPLKPPNEERLRIASSDTGTGEPPREPPRQPQPDEVLTSTTEVSDDESLPTGGSAIDTTGGSAIANLGPGADVPTEHNTAQSDAAQPGAVSGDTPVAVDFLADPKNEVATAISQPETRSDDPEPDAVPAQPAMESGDSERGEIDAAPPAPSSDPASAPSSAPTHAREPTSCVPLCEPPLTDDEITELTRIVLHSERFALFMYEAACIHARRKGAPPPQAQLLDLGVDEQKRVRRVAQDTRLRSATADLLSAWFQLRRAGAEKMRDLPPPFSSVTDAEISAVAALTTDPERFKYAMYRHARFAALYLEEKLPEHPQTSLAAKERAAVRKLLHDIRLLVMFEEAVRRLASPHSLGTSDDRSEVPGD